MPHARKKNVHAKRLKLLKPRAAPINTCVENDDWPRSKPGGEFRITNYELVGGISNYELVEKDIWVPA
jgi:hypothetical protein